MAEVQDIGKGSKGFNLEPRLCNEAVLMLGYSYWSQASGWKLLRTDRNHMNRLRNHFLSKRPI
jgi:hypothetical protein